MEIDFTLLAMGLTALIGIGGAVFGVQFQGKYKQALEAMVEVGQFLSLISGTIKEISDALVDETLTPDELKLIQQRLVKIKIILDELQMDLVK